MYLEVVFPGWTSVMAELWACARGSGQGGDTLGTRAQAAQGAGAAAGGTVSTGSAGPVGPRQACPASGLLHGSWFPGTGHIRLCVTGINHFHKAGL